MDFGLPSEIISQIFSYLTDPEDINNLSLVYKEYHNNILENITELSLSKSFEKLYIAFQIPKRIKVKYLQRFKRLRKVKIPIILIDENDIMCLASLENLYSFNCLIPINSIENKDTEVEKYSQSILTIFRFLNNRKSKFHDEILYRFTDIENPEQYILIMNNIITGNFPPISEYKEQENIIWYNILWDNILLPMQNLSNLYGLYEILTVRVDPSRIDIININFPNLTIISYNPSEELIYSLVLLYKTNARILKISRAWWEYKYLTKIIDELEDFPEPEVLSQKQVLYRIEIPFNLTTYHKYHKILSFFKTIESIAIFPDLDIVKDKHRNNLIFFMDNYINDETIKNLKDKYPNLIDDLLKLYPTIKKIYIYTSVPKSKLPQRYLSNLFEIRPTKIEKTDIIKIRLFE